MPSHHHAGITGGDHYIGGPDTAEKMKVRGRAYAYFNDKHQSWFVGKHLDEGFKKPRGLENLTWAITTLPMFCANKSEIISFVSIAQLTETEITTLDAFLDDFAHNNGRELDPVCVENIKALIQNEREYQRDSVNIVPPIPKTTALGTKLAGLVNDIHVVPIQTPVDDEIDIDDGSNIENPENPIGAEGIRPIVPKDTEVASKKEFSSEVEAFLKRGKRRYIDLITKYNIEQLALPKTPEELKQLLEDFIQGHLGGEQWDGERILRFEDMGAGIDDSHEGIAYLIVLVRQVIKDKINWEEVMSSVQSSTAVEKSTQDTAFFKFLTYIYNEESRKQGQAAVIREELLNKLSFLDATITLAMRTSSQIREELERLR